MRKKRYLYEYIRDLAEARDRLAYAIVVALSVPLAWLAGHAIRLYQRIEDWRESRKG